MAETLETTSKHAQDPAFGAGIELTLDPEGIARLTLYPTPSVEENDGETETFTAVQLTTPTARLELFRAQAEIDDDLLRFSSASAAGDITQLLIRPDGGVIVQFSPHDAGSAAQSPATASITPQRPDIPDGGQTPENRSPENDSEDPEEGIPTASDENGGKEQQRRLTILGRIGRTPRFRETRKGTKIASFPVAVPEDDGSTTWRQVTVFNERAEVLAGMGIDTGDRVEVIGYLHERQRRRRDGTPYTSEELYAAVIKLR